MEDHVCAKAEMLGRHEADIENLKDWQKKQNGVLQRLADRLDKLFANQRAVIASVAASAILLALNIVLMLEIMSRLGVKTP